MHALAPGAGLPRLAESIPDIAVSDAWLPAARYWHGTLPEWDVVSATLDSRRILLGEAKWMEPKATERDTMAVYQALSRKGVPSVRGVDGADVTRCVFVPATASRLKPDGFVVITARQVLAALQ